MTPDAINVKNTFSKKTKNYKGVKEQVDCFLILLRFLLLFFNRTVV